MRLPSTRDAGPAPAGRAARLRVDLAHALGGVDDRPVAGAAAQVAGQRVVDGLARRRVRALVEPEQAHREARRAEAALRGMALDQRLLHRVQAPVGRGERLDGEHRLAVERRQRPDAGVDRLPASVPSPRDAATTTVHAPQSPSAQPSLVPVSWRVSRSHCSSVVCGGHAGDVHPLAVQHEADRVHRRGSPGACQSGMAFSRYIAARTPLGRPSLPIERRKMPSISPVT